MKYTLATSRGHWYAPHMLPPSVGGCNKGATVTRSNSVCRETARELADRGFHVVLACRNTAAGDTAAAAIAESTGCTLVQSSKLKPSLCNGGGRTPSAASASRAASSQQSGSTGAVEVQQLDLVDQDSIRTFTDEFIKSHKRLDVLVNNAGCNTRPKWRLESGVLGMAMVRKGLQQVSGSLLASPTVSKQTCHV